MVQYLSQDRRASIFARLHTPGLSNREIAQAEGISEAYVRKLRVKERIYGKPWPEMRTPQNSTKLIPAAEEVWRRWVSVSHTIS
jgi:transposase